MGIAVERGGHGMSDQISRRETSDAVSGQGWRFVLGSISTRVRVASLAQAAEVAARVSAVCGPDEEESLDIRLRQDHLALTLRSPGTPLPTRREVELAGRVAAAVRELGLATDAGPPHPVQELEIAIDAMDIPAVYPFWKAVLGYADEPWATEPMDGLADPTGRGPAFWFQQMDEPRPQRNRIHIDISVAHDEAARRIEAALAAGGRITYDEAPAFWVLADPEGNEACVCTWQGRDKQEAME
jgi:4a-hydroxytetrahydrobiopterin dehydratase